MTSVEIGAVENNGVKTSCYVLVAHMTVGGVLELVRMRG